MLRGCQDKFNLVTQAMLLFGFCGVVSVAQLVKETCNKLEL